MKLPVYEIILFVFFTLCVRVSFSTDIYKNPIIDYSLPDPTVLNMIG